MSCEYPTIISKLSLSKIRLGKSLYVRYLFQQFPIIFYLLKEKSENEDKYDDETIIDYLQNYHTNNDTKYLQFLYQQYVETLQSLVDDFGNAKNRYDKRTSFVSDFMKQYDQQEAYEAIMRCFTKLRINDINRKAIKKIIDRLLGDEDFIENYINKDRQSFDILKDVCEKIK